MTALARAQAALDRGAWREARDDLRSDEATAGDPARLELLARACYGDGDLEAAVSSYEDAHRLLVGAGEEVEAARVAAMVALHLMMDTGLMAPVRGWLARAERLLAGHGDVPPYALVAMVRTYERFMSGDAVSATQQAALSIELGERHDVLPAVVVGRTAAARLRISAGDVEGGLALLDEVAAVLMSGDVDALTTGMMYCELICAAQNLAHHERAREWTDVMEHWRHGVAFGAIHGRCRVHRAELLRVSGPAGAAETEALAACAELRPWMRREFGWPLVELGTIRLRAGDLDGADEAFRSAHEHAWCPHPGLALLRLEQGRPGEAAELIASAIEHPLDIPSKERPPFDELRLAPLLEAQAAIASVTGDVVTLERAASALEAIAERYPTTGLAATASFARGRAALAQDRLPQAAECCAVAISSWVEAGAPYEAAVARVVLGDVHQAAGQHAPARLEWESAHAAFVAFGALGQASRVARQLQPSGGADGLLPEVGSEVGPTVATFRRQGGLRRVGLAGVEIDLVDLVGFRYLERLLAEPGREHHVLDLVAQEQGVVTRPGGCVEGSVDVGAGLPVLDDVAREAYRRRLREVDEDIEEARSMDDLGRLALAERDRDYLVHELASAVGLGGRPRTTGGSAERARSSVTRSLRYALRRLAEQHPDLAAHLDRTVCTGTYCSYRADPLVPVVWELR
ncbi:hypothetical protein [Nocardioides sp.]|uniref:hypothetical protein n=1 Tax=Nocardioides sp. TaxID=35761 RepID=UPI00286A775F|nr:hypothetical protein [Nocardioides sp.]